MLREHFIQSSMQSSQQSKSRCGISFQMRTLRLRSPGPTATVQPSTGSEPPMTDRLHTCSSHTYTEIPDSLVVVRGHFKFTKKYICISKVAVRSSFSCFIPKFFCYKETLKEKAQVRQSHESGTISSPRSTAGEAAPGPALTCSWAMTASLKLPRR